MNKKTYRLMCVVCWLGTAISAFLLAYLLHVAQKVPNGDSLTGSIRLVGVLLLVWLAVSSFFTVRAYQNRKDRK